MAYQLGDTLRRCKNGARDTGLSYTCSGGYSRLTDALPAISPRLASDLRSGVYFVSPFADFAIECGELVMEAERSALPDSDPLGLFGAWFAEARESEPNDANAMALATATPDGLPSVRMVLLKDFGSDGFTFYTNAESRKGGEIRANPHAALLFHWKSLRRQIRIEGPLTEVSPAQADDYFHSRAFVSQVGSAASDQSRPLDHRQTYVDRVEALESEWKAAGEVPRPAHWTGFTLAPTAIEFWLDRPNRLHDRRRFVSDGKGGWTSTLLYP